MSRRAIACVGSSRGSRWRRAAAQWRAGLSQPQPAGDTQTVSKQGYSRAAQAMVQQSGHYLAVYDDGHANGLITREGGFWTNWATEGVWP